MSSVHLVLLSAALVVSMAVLTASSRATRWPKPQSTKKPPRGGGSSGAGGGGFVQAATMTSLSSMHTDETTEVMLDTHSLAPTDSTTYAIDTYPTDFHVDAVAPPGNNLENYTVDYNECFFNVCECCPMVKGIMGPMGERGPPGSPGERGPLGKMDHCSQEKIHLVSKLSKILFSLNRVARTEGRNWAQRTPRTSRATWSQWAQR